MSDVATADMGLKGQTGELAVVSPLEDAVLAQLAKAFPDMSLSGFATVDAAATGSEGRIVWAALPPTEAVAWALASGARAEAAVSAWVAQTEPAMAAARRLRRRLWCVDARSVVAGGALALPGAAEVVITGEALPLPPMVSLAIAELLIAHHPQAARLAMELAAMLRGPQGVAVDMPLLAAAQDEADGTRVTVAEQAAELQMFRETLKMQVAQADEMAASRAAADAAIAALRQAVTVEKQTVADLSRDLETFRANLALQVAQASEVAALRAADAAEIAALRQAGEAARRALAEQHADLARLRETVAQQMQQAQEDARLRDAAAAERQAEVQLLRENLHLQVDHVDGQAALHAAHAAEMARLTAEAAAAREAAARGQAELRLLREHIGLQIKQADQIALQHAAAMAEAAKDQKLAAENALLLAEIKALKQRQAEALRLAKMRDQVMGRVLLEDQAALEAAGKRSDNLIARLLKAEGERDLALR